MKKKKNKEVVIMPPRSVIYSWWDLQLEKMKWEEENKK